MSDPGRVRTLHILRVSFNLYLLLTAGLTLDMQGPRHTLSIFSWFDWWQVRDWLYSSSVLISHQFILFRYKIMREIDIFMRFMLQLVLSKQITIVFWRMTWWKIYLASLSPFLEIIFWKVEQRTEKEKYESGMYYSRFHSKIYIFTQRHHHMILAIRGGHVLHLLEDSFEHTIHLNEKSNYNVVLL